MPVDLHVSERQYWDHLRPVAEALGEDLGTITTSEQLRSIVPHGKIGYPEPNQNLTLVASFQDSHAARTRGRKVIYMEHGAGQTYNTNELHPSYSGGPEHEGTVMFLCPREEVAHRWQKVYRDIPAVVVGSPRMDELRKLKDDLEWQCKDGKTVAISFHSDVRLCPESSSAWPEYNIYLKQEIAKLNARGVHVLGHAHPRLFRHIRAYWESTGAEPVENIEDIYKRASTYAVDNSSTLYEAAALDIPTVAINASWYRKDVNHGLRFWDRIPGEYCNTPGQLAALLLSAQPEGDKFWADKRREISEYVWGIADGQATRRAVEAIRNLL